MKILVVYDSQFGNTEKVARTVAEVIEKGNEVTLAKPKALKEIDSDLDLIIVGSPVQGGRAVPSILNFIANIPDNSLKNVKLATFDTRIEMFIAKVIGYAAPRIAKSFKHTGATLVSPPAGFIVTDKEGPLKAGELDRAKIWASQVLENASV